MKKICLFLFFTLPCSFVYSSNKTQNASIGFGVATIGTTLNGYIAYYFYKKYKSIPSQTTDFLLIAKRKKYAALSTLFALNGLLCLTGGTIYGITQLLQPSPRSLLQVDVPIMPQQEEFFSSPPEKAVPLPQETQLKTLKRKKPKGPSGRRPPTQRRDSHNLVQDVGEDESPQDDSQNALGAFKALPIDHQNPANDQQKQFVKKLNERLNATQNPDAKRALAHAVVALQFHDREATSKALITVFQELGFTSEHIKEFQEMGTFSIIQQQLE